MCGCLGFRKFRFTMATQKFGSLLRIGKVFKRTMCRRNGMVTYLPKVLWYVLQYVHYEEWALVTGEGSNRPSTPNFPLSHPPGTLLFQGSCIRFQASKPPLADHFNKARTHACLSELISQSFPLRDKRYKRTGKSATFLLLKR